LPDADEYGDKGSNSLQNASRSVGGVTFPNLESLGLGNLTEIQGIHPRLYTCGAYGKMAEKSKGKDTITGHWEMMGIITDEAWPTYPNGFPKSIIEIFEKRIGRKVIGNTPASGTEIINKLGDQHLETGNLIVYTSSDSVFQIAAHEDIIPINDLYRICEIAREILVGDHRVGRVIARPFIGTSGKYARTKRRRDWSVKPPEDMLLNKLVRSNLEVISVGKIDDIFSFHGITKSLHTTNNQDSIKETVRMLQTQFTGLLFVNLIDFDMIYEHRRNPKLYMNALKAF
jgi:phosphopentomutase